MKKQSKTAIKTRETLINSFWNLYKREDLNKITIDKICSEAEYERTTLYYEFR